MVGWVWETGLNLVLRKKWVDRGILNGPLCPIYGFGAASVIVLLHDVDNPIALFLSSGMLACTLEYFSSWAIEKLFHIRLWDYTGKRINLLGTEKITKTWKGGNSHVKYEKNRTNSPL